MSYLYQFSLVSPNSNNFEVYLPLILEENGNVSQLMNEIQIVGNATLHIAETIKGKALIISGQGNIQANIDYLKNNEGIPYLSLTNYSQHDPSYFFESELPLPVWIYSNQSDIEIELIFFYNYFILNGFLLNPIGYSTRWVHSLTNFTTSNGWNNTYFMIYPMYID